jgi:hypothetical protein
MKPIRTLCSFRNLIKALPSYNDVFEYIYTKHVDNVYVRENATLKQVEKSYSLVIDELLSKPIVIPYEFPIVVKTGKDMIDKTSFVDVCLKNLKFVAPKKGLKPWGCVDGQLPPNGHYDINNTCHNKYISLDTVPWSEIIDTNVIVEKNSNHLKLHEIVAEIIWEITFYGLSEKSQSFRIKRLEKELLKRLDAIESSDNIEYLSLDEFKDQLRKIKNEK